jgi:myosin V
VRFLNNNQIYTYCGIVLVAINPYEQLSIYGNEMIKMYNGQDVQNMDPHIFAVSEDAFQKMIQYDQNQSIIVSGESGAGKTVSAKYTMRYFANVGGSSEETQVEKKVLASNPIMEAFGNAKTTRNDNSSRFGKFIQIDFNRKHHIVGANMKTYLLEKSRVVFQSDNERNYHIFYQLCSQSNNKEYNHLKLAQATQFFYTNQGQAEIIDHINDSQVFKETLDAFKMLEINKKDQMSIFSLLSSIMHLGNVKIIHECVNESSCVARNDESIKDMCELLQIDERSLSTWICNKRIRTVNEQVVTPLTLQQAIFSRDALAKHIYSHLFNWIVKQINKCLKSPVKTHSFIGVLDIYGFETFEVNSFEQFCINYANEKLQQQFCQHVFKLEQEEYMREQIKWSFIEFYDNQPCIELIEGKLGILDLLDEECKMPRGTDDTWCQKLYGKHLKNETDNTNAAPKSSSVHFSKPRMSSKAFIIHHFAENVEYQVNGFLEKNRDTVLEEQLKVLGTSSIEFVSQLFSEPSDEEINNSQRLSMNSSSNSKQNSLSLRRKTVGSQFRESLNHLMQALNSTTPHYVRCIKPNDNKEAFKFESKRAVEQLRACGVLETVRISAAGYPSRWTYQEFFFRYRMLVNSNEINRSKLKETCETILQSLIKEKTKYQFGKTKIFFQAGQVAYLEKLRTEKLKASGIIIQKHIRGWLAYSKYNKMKKSALLIQTYTRSLLARRLVQFKRETRSAILIQSKWRSYIERKKFLIIRDRMIKLQAICRRYLARENKRMILSNIKATIIQAHVRGWLQRRRYQRIMKGIVMFQAHVRRRQARRIFKTLKTEARSVEHQRKLNKGLENKIISLQQSIQKVTKERDSIKDKIAEIEPLKAQLQVFRQNSNTVKETANKLAELTREMKELKDNYDTVCKERDELLKNKTNLQKNQKETESKMKKQSEEQANQLADAIQLNQQLQQQIDDYKLQMTDIENDRKNHQKLVQDYNKLEQRFDKARNDILNYSKTAQQQQHQKGSPSELESLVEDLQLDQYDNDNQSERSSVVSNYSSGIGTIKINGNHSNFNGKNGNELDVSLLNKLYRRIALLESQNKFYNSKKSDHDDNNNMNNNNLLRNSPTIIIEKLQQENDYEMIRAQELEMENYKLREELDRFRDLIADNQVGIDGTPVTRELMIQFDTMSEEVQKRREECIQLKSMLINRHRERTIGGSSSIHDRQMVNSTLINDLDNIDMDLDTINTNGNELEIGYNAQKITNRMLENQMLEMKKRFDAEKAADQKQIEALIEENDKQHDLLMQNLLPEALAEATLKNEMFKLAEQNFVINFKHLFSS